MYSSGIDCHHDGRAAIEFAKKLELELAAVTRVKQGYEENMPTCGACAEAIICGSVSIQHDANCPHNTFDNTGLLEAAARTHSQPK